MKTKNKNYSEYVDCYDDSWETVLNDLSEKMKLDTLGCRVVADPDNLGKRVLAVYCYNTQDAERKMRTVHALGYEATIEFGYGPGILLVYKNESEAE